MTGGRRRDGTSSRPRWSSLVGDLAVLMGVSGLVAGCNSGGATPGPCGVRQESDLAPSPMTLSSDAALDPMGTAFFLHSADTDGGTVRWAQLSATGTLGTEHQASLPPHMTGFGPWMATAGTASPFDRVLVFFVAPSGVEQNATALWVSSFPFDGLAAGVATPTPLEVVRLPGPASALRVSVGSGLAGLHAGVAFGLSGLESLTFLVLDGRGSPVGAPQIAGGGADALDFKCLRVTSTFGGPADLTLSYVRQRSEVDPAPSWRFLTVDETGILGASTSMVLSGTNPACPSMVLPSDGTVAVAWQDLGHAWFVDWQPALAQLFPKEIDAAAAQPGGTLRPIVGLGTFSKGFGLLYDSPQGGALRVLDANAAQLQDDVALPARAGHVGHLAAVPRGTSLYATYADYDTAGSATGRRAFLRLACE